MITLWVTPSITYYKIADIPVYVHPNEDLLLLRLDHLGFYFPRIYFLKFDLIRALLTTSMKCESRNPLMQIAPQKMVDCIDLTKDFLEKANVGRINYNEFPNILFNLLTGNEHEIKKCKKFYEPLIPFFEFLGLEQKYMDLINT